jgi:hypothetical protein
MFFLTKWRKLASKKWKNHSDSPLEQTAQILLFRKKRLPPRVTYHVSRVRAALLITTSNKKQLNWSRANSRHVDRWRDDTFRSISSSHATIWSSRLSSPSPIHLHLSPDFIEATLQSWTKTCSKKFHHRPPVVLSFFFLVSFDTERESFTCEIHSSPSKSSYFGTVSLKWFDP